MKVKAQACTSGESSMRSRVRPQIGRFQDRRVEFDFGRRTRVPVRTRFRPVERRDHLEDGLAILDGGHLPGIE
jgi:hypothetical protein